MIQPDGSREAEPPEPVRFKLLTHDDELMALVPDWQALLQSSDQAEPVLSPDWILGWWRHYADKRTLAVGTFYVGKILVGLALLCRRHYRYDLGALPVKLGFQRLECLGGGCDEADEVSSDYLGLLASREHETRVANAFVQHLFQDSFGSWDECVLEMMNGDAPMTGHIQRAFKDQGYNTALTQVSEAPYLTLPESWDSYLESLGSKRRYWFRRTLRDFEKWAPHYTLHKADTPDSLHTGMQHLVNLHEERWRKSGQEGAFAEKRFLAFHQDYARKLLDANRLQLYWITVDGEPVVAQYNIMNQNKIYLYQSGRKMDVPRKVRLGIVLLMLILQEAMESGKHEFDFLAGKNGYKYDFTRTVRPIVQLRIARKGLRESARILLKTARDTIRRKPDNRA